MSRIPLILLLVAVIAALVSFGVLVDEQSLADGLGGIAAGIGVSYNQLLATIGTGLLGTIAGVVGTYAVLRNRALVGDTVAHASLPGICLAVLLTGQRDFVELMIGAALAGLLGMYLVHLFTRYSRLKNDAALGIVLSSFFGLGIAMIGTIPSTGDVTRSGLESFLFGQAAAMLASDVLGLIGVGGALILLVLILRKEFRLVTFDAPYAGAQGWPAGLIDGLILAMLVVATVIGLPAVGVVLIAALILMPGVTARFWTDSLGRMLVLAAIIGAATGILGTTVAASLPNVPTGPAIVLTGTAIFTLSALAAPRRGVVVQAWLAWRARRSDRAYAMLRDWYRHHVATSDDAPVKDRMPLSGPIRKAWEAHGWLRPDGDGLSPEGVRQAAIAVRDRRLAARILSKDVPCDIDLRRLHRHDGSWQRALDRETLVALEDRLRLDNAWPEPAPSIVADGGEAGRG